MSKEDGPMIYGIVVRCDLNSDMSRYGFVRPDNTSGGEDVWFGCRCAANAAPIGIGDRVRFTTKPDPKGGRDIVAKIRQAPQPKTITTFHGEDEASWR